MQFALYSRAYHFFPNTVVIKIVTLVKTKAQVDNLPLVESYLVAIENSTFENNEASDFGGAVVLAAQPLFESMERFQKFNIFNW